MSPIEDVRNQAFALLADPEHGLNRELANQCAARNIPIPTGSSGSTNAEPFDFGQYSRNVFQIRADVDWWNSQDPSNPVNYPNLFIYGLSASQVTFDGRPMGAIFWGDVSLEIVSYLAWTNDQPAVANNYEAPLDALEDSFLSVLNRDSNEWLSPALYRNTLSTRDRFPLTRMPNDNNIFRTGIRLNLTCRYLIERRAF